MKKLFLLMLSLLLVLAPLTAAAAAPASGEPLPFELKAPANVSLARTDWCSGDSPTTHGFSYSVDKDVIDFFDAFSNSEDHEAFLAPYGLSDIWLNIQVDWALDDVNDPVSGWHYTEYWDYDPIFGFGYDEDGRQRISEWDIVDSGVDVHQTVNEIWVLRGVPDDFRWNGDPETGWIGVKEQLNPDQYVYQDDNVFIDWSEHTAYMRARFALVCWPIDAESATVTFSDWSATASAGKDAEAYVPLTAADLPAPIITGLRMTDEEFNGNPVVAFTLTVPDELAAMASRVASVGGSISVWTYARVKGDTEWTEMGNTDSEVTPGELKCALLHLVSDERPVITKDTVIELRCRYYCYQPETEDIYSDYSKIISFGTDDISQGGSQGGESTATPGPEGEPTADSCPICHFCPRPLGICIFIWLAILILIIIVIIIIAAASKKKRR